MDFFITSYDLDRHLGRWKKKNILERFFIRAENISLPWWKVLLNDPCVYCGEKADSIEHILPTSKGGKDNNENYAPACQQCNNRRSNKPLLLFIRKMYHDKARYEKKGYKYTSYLSDTERKRLGKTRF